MGLHHCPTFHRNQYPPTSKLFQAPCWADGTSSLSNIPSQSVSANFQTFPSTLLGRWDFIISSLAARPVTFPLSCSKLLKISSYFGLSFATTHPNSSAPSSTPTPPGITESSKMPPVIIVLPSDSLSLSSAGINFIRLGISSPIIFDASSIILRSRLLNFVKS